MRVLAVTSEIYPLIKTGGLADVAGALPLALKAEGIAQTTCVPGYPKVLEALQNQQIIATLPSLFGGQARIISGEAAGLDLLVLDAPHLFDRLGNPYAAPNGQDWPDNATRYAALSQVAAQLARGDIGTSFEAVHLHDWQAGLTAAYLKYFGGPPSIVTIHNLAFQGQFPAYVFATLGLPPESFNMDGIEYYGGVGFLKAAIRLASAITTVSPAYAREIQTTGEGMGLDGLLRIRAPELHGILNGIDTNEWNPEKDKALTKNFNVTTLNSRAANKRAIEERFELNSSEGPLFCIISRLTNQKGMDLVLNAIPDMVAQGARLAVLGSGEPALEAGFRAAAAAHPGLVNLSTAYDENLAHLMQGGCDAILIPSRFEPCGLTQLYGLHYGCVPIVSRVGGLADTIVDANEAALNAGAATGIVFSPPTPENLAGALTRAIALYNDKPTWAKLQTNGMQAEVSWKNSAKKYAALFRSMRS